MKDRDADLQRLLRSAAGVRDESTPEAPFGFETRVVALWRAGQGRSGDAAELGRFARRIGLTAVAVLIMAGAGAYQLSHDNEERTTPQINEYAIADSAIQTEFSQ